MILSDSAPPKVFDGILLKSWFKRGLKMEFLSEVVMGKIMKGGKVVLLLSGRLVQLLAVFYCPIFGEIPLSELKSTLGSFCSMCDTVVVHQVCRKKGSYREALRRGN